MTASVTLHVQDPEIENERGKTAERGAWKEEAGIATEELIHGPSPW